MSAVTTQPLAVTAFQLVVAPTTSCPLPSGRDLEGMLTLAGRNGVLLRCVAVLRQAGRSLPLPAETLVLQEEQRAARFRLAVTDLAGACSRSGLEPMFLGVGQHEPDVGRDLDLLVMEAAEAVHSCLEGELGAVRLQRSLLARLAGTAAYRLPSGIVLDVHFGRLGPCGDQERLPVLMFQRQGHFTLGTHVLRVPSREDRLVLYGLERLHGRARLRLSHLVWLVATLRDGDIDWDRVLRTARECGALPGLSRLIAFTEQAHALLLGRELDLPAGGRALITSSPGRIRWQGDGFSFPLVRTNACLHAARLANEVAARRWLAVLRLSLAPFVVSTNAGWRLRRSVSELEFRPAAEGPTP